MKRLPTPTFVASPGGPYFDQSSVLALRPGIVPYCLSHKNLSTFPFFFLSFFVFLLASLAENTSFVCTRHVKKLNDTSILLVQPLQLCHQPFLITMIIYTDATQFECISFSFF